MNVEPPGHDAGVTPYAPLDGPDGVLCSFCGRPQDDSLLVVANGDGSAAICEECTSSHAVFFERQRQPHR